MRQLNILLAYSYFYNPLRFLKALVWSKTKRGWFVDAALQAWGMAGLMRNWWRSPRWMWHLFWGGKKIVRSTDAPRSPIPMQAPDGSMAAHDLPDGPDPKTIRRDETIPYEEAENAARAVRQRPSLMGEPTAS